MAPHLTVAEPVPFVRAKLKQICPKLSDSLGGRKPAHAFSSLPHSPQLHHVTPQERAAKRRQFRQRRS